MDEKKTFKKGAKVRWETLGRGSRCVREGEIIATVPAMSDPNEYAECSHLPFGKRKRETKSYIVRGDNGKVYWPIVTTLELI